MSCILPTMSLGLGGLLNLETVDGLLSYVYFFISPSSECRVVNIDMACLSPSMRNKCLPNGI